MNESKTQMRNDILNSLADDYENIDTIISQLQGVSRNVVVKQVSDMVQENLIKPHIYNDKTKHLEACELELSKIDNYWFGLTKKGEELFKDIYS